MLYNKKLGITDEMVYAETSIEQLTIWKADLVAQIQSIKLRQNQDLTSVQMKRTGDARLFINQLLTITEGRIVQLKSEKSGDVKLMRKFMKVAKKKLSKELYKEILSEAKIISGYNDKADAATA